MILPTIITSPNHSPAVLSVNVIKKAPEMLTSTQSSLIKMTRYSLGRKMIEIKKVHGLISVVKVSVELRDV